MIEIECFSRINFGLIDLSSEPFRIDGATGMAINLKLGKIRLEQSKELILNLNCVNKQRCIDVAFRSLKMIGKKNFSLYVESYVDEHVGLGSGTQLAMSIAEAVNREFKLNLNIDEIATIAGSGGTTNIGVYSFLHGGFNVDSGRLYPEEKMSIGPGEMFAFKRLSTLLMRLDMPEWYLCIVIPDIPLKIFGAYEIDLFKNYTPISVNEVDNLCKWILTGVLPSVKHSDFNSFCYCIEQCMSIGFRAKEINSYGVVIKDTIVDLKSAGAKGVGMSSFGPAVFGFYETHEKALIGYEKIKILNKYNTIYLTKPRNQGANIKCY